MTKDFLILGATLVALSLTACSATGDPYTPAKAYDGEAKIVVYKTQTYGNAVSFTMNGQKCKVKPQGYVDFTVPANSLVTLRHRSIGDPSPSVFAFTPKARETYLIRVETNTASIAAGAVFGTAGGLVGGTIGTAAVTNEGTFIFREGTEAEALTTRDSGGC